MSATADLRSEHVGVGRMLGVMDAMAARLQAGEAVPADDVAQTVEFLQVFVDQCHHTKEEKLLFPAISAANITSAQDAIAILLGDHDHGREAVARMAAATERLVAGDESGKAELLAVIPGYTQLLHAHIRREESDCFDVADRELPAAVQEELVAGYERIERDVVGQGRHEAFHAMIDRLSEDYRV